MNISLEALLARGRHEGLFAQYNKVGRDWIRRITPEDRKVLSDLGVEMGDYRRMGGRARAATALRDTKGRFVANTPSNRVLAAIFNDRVPIYEPPEVHHSDACLKARDAYEAYCKTWPDHCHKCDATGYRCYSYDPSPKGVSLSPGTMTDCDPCPECVENGQCPRCRHLVWRDDGEEFTEAGVAICPDCHWQDSNSADAAPIWECYCWEA